LLLPSSGSEDFSKNELQGRGGVLLYKEAVGIREPVGVVMSSG